MRFLGEEITFRSQRIQWKDTIVNYCLSMEPLGLFQPAARGTCSFTWQNVEPSSLFQKRAINKRLMDEWKCLLRLQAEQLGSARFGSPRREGRFQGLRVWRGQWVPTAPRKGESGLQRWGEGGDSSGRKNSLLLRGGWRGGSAFDFSLLCELVTLLFSPLLLSPVGAGASWPGSPAFPSHPPQAKQRSSREGHGRCTKLWHARRVNQGVKQNLCSQLADVSKENISNAERDWAVSRWCNYMAVSCRNSFNVAHIKPFRGNALIFNFTLLAGNQGL